MFGGGGGVIVPSEIKALHDYGVTRIFSPEDGQKLGLQGMINEIVAAADVDLAQRFPQSIDGAARGRPLRAHARARAHDHRARSGRRAAARSAQALLDAAANAKTPVLGITGTGGAGKSSLTDELVRRFRLDQRDRLKIAILSIDPSRRKSGGALLGDRIRMNAIDTPNIYMRSLATRDAGSEISKALPDAIAACKAAGFDLVIVETSGIGQGDAAIVPHVDVSLYVMTPEFGAASQLEKIDMLDFADFVAINKFDRKGAQDALRDVRKQYQRNRELFKVRARRNAGVRDDRVALQRRRRHRAVPGDRAARCGRTGWRSPTGALRAACRRATRRSSTRSSRRRACATSPRSPRRCAAITGGRDAQSRIARERQQLRAAKAMLATGESRVRDDFRQGALRRKSSLTLHVGARRADRRARREARRALEEAARHVAAHARPRTAATSTS